MNSELRKLGAIFAVLLMLGSMIGGAAAAVAWDTETTTTTTTSDISGTSNTVTYYAGNSGQSVYSEVTSAQSGTNYTLQVSPAQSGVDYIAYENASAATPASGHRAWNVSHAELDIPRDINGGTYNVTVINESDGSKELTTEVTLSTADSVENPKAVMALTEQTTDDGAAMTHLVADRLELSSKSPGWGAEIVSLGGANETTVATWSGYTTVNGTNTPVEVRLANSSSAEAYADAAESYDDGDWIRESTIFINGVPHKVYKNQAPEDHNGTAVVYNQNADKLEISTAGAEYENVSTLQLRGAAGEKYGFGELWSNFGWMTALGSLNPF